MRPPTIFFYGGSENLQQNQQPHFLDSCFLCHKQIAHNSDIFMYRGNTPFCSEECRQEQIEIDDANEKRLKKASSSTSSSSKRASSKNRNNPAESSQESNTNKAVRTEAVAVV